MAYEIEFSEPLNPDLVGEDTAKTGWVYEGVKSLEARDRFNGTTFNRPTRYVLKMLLELKDFVLEYMNKPFVTGQYADGSITYDKLSGAVKAKFNQGSGSGGSDNYTMVARRLKMFTRVYNRDTEKSILKTAINAR